MQVIWFLMETVFPLFQGSFWPVESLFDVIGAVKIQFIKPRSRRAITQQQIEVLVVPRWYVSLGLLAAFVAGIYVAYLVRELPLLWLLGSVAVLNVGGRYAKSVKLNVKVKRNWYKFPLRFPLTLAAGFQLAAIVFMLYQAVTWLL